MDHIITDILNTTLIQAYFICRQRDFFSGLAKKNALFRKEQGTGMTYRKVCVEMT